MAEVKEEKEIKEEKLKKNNEEIKEQEVKPEVKKKNNKTIIAIILLLIALFGLTCYFILDKNVHTANPQKEDTSAVDEKDPVEETNEDEKEPTEETEKPNEEENKPVVEKAETEIKDSNKIKKLEDNMLYLNSIDCGITECAPSIYQKNTTTKDLTDSQKLSSILFYIYKNTEEFNEITIDEFKEVYSELYTGEGDDIYEFYQVKEQIILDKYKAVYGSTPSNYKIDSNCPEFRYSDKFKKFYGASRCGGYGGSKILTYNYKFTESDDKAYVYTSVALQVFENETPVIFTDYNKTKEYKRGDAALDVEINSTNYQEFSKYKITFTKSDNNYYFESVEKLEN